MAVEAFRTEVLGWRVRDLLNDDLVLGGHQDEQHPALPAVYDRALTFAAYAGTFGPYVREEVRAEAKSLLDRDESLCILRLAGGSVSVQPCGKTRLSVLASRDCHVVEGKVGATLPLRPDTLLLLTSSAYGAKILDENEPYVLALTRFVSSDATEEVERPQTAFEALVHAGRLEEEEGLLTDVMAAVFVRVLGTVLKAERIFAAMERVGKAPAFLPMALSGARSPDYEAGSGWRLEPSAELRQLDESQIRASRMVLEAPEGRVSIIQGPPGTG